MSELLNTYPVFESNQVLTSTQLNKLVNYLDRQNRLTRAKLIGMGVVCGLEISCDTSENELTISKGTGITSEGYLINLGECKTVKYRPYSLPPGTIYEPFVNSSNVQDIKLYELLTEKADDGPDVKTLDNEVFLTDKVVLLFIESFDKDLKSCLGKSCDELGKERILTIRKLLISKDDLKTVWNRTNTGKLDAMFPEKYYLPVVNMPRTLFDPSKPHTSDYTEFSLLYAKTILNVFDDLFDALNETYAVYRPLFLESYNGQNPFEENPVADKISTIRNFLENTDTTFTPYLGVQYIYDLFLDLILAYNEFRLTAFDLMSECSPDMTRFPKHLMLGEALGGSLSLCEQSEYRHYFVQPPVYNLQKQLVQKTIALHNRIVLMLESFDLERINGLTEGEEGMGFPIRITPGLEKRSTLSRRSVPWYYDVNLLSSYDNLGRLKDYWDFDASRTCPLEADGLVLTYDDQLDDQSTAKDKLSTPLFYDIQDYSFFRIEGYINTGFSLALSRINDLKKQFNLPFDTVALQLDPDAGTLELDYNCGFEDIQEEYKMARANLCGIVYDLRVIYKFIKENSGVIFNDDEKGDIEEILKRVKDLIELLVTLCAAMKDCVQDFDFVRFRLIYKEVLEYILDFFLVDMELMKKVEIGEEDQEQQISLINGGFQRVFPLIFKIVDLLFYNKFLRIYYAFKQREYYLRKETAVFSTFINRHPGIDHQAGVRKGGTFIMLYKDGEDDTVFADFNLPYLCCGSENCVPMCDDGSFNFDLPPFARPDYAVTTIDNSVEVDVLRNDYQMLGGEFEIDSVDTSETTGGVSQGSETGPLTYIPKEGFIGFDYFNYTLTNVKTGKSDIAKVTILVKKPGEEDKGCYNVQILQCWGEVPVRETLAKRGVEIGPGDNIFRLLLNDLQATGGFTDEEISGGVLEDGDRRRQLLTCIGLPVNDNTSYKQMGEMIRQYQKDNCGGGKPEPACYSIPILKCWGINNVIQFLNFIKQDPGQDPVIKLLDYLRKNKGFSENEMDFLLETGTMFGLLQCIFPDISDDIGAGQMKEILQQYQTENCQGSPRKPGIAVNPGLMTTGDMVKILGGRGITMNPGEPRAEMVKALKSSEGSMRLSKSEMKLLTKKSIINILKAKKITFGTGDNKAKLILKMFKV